MQSSSDKKKIERLEAKVAELKAENALLASSNAKLSEFLRRAGISGAPPILSGLEALRAVEVDGVTPEQLAERFMIKPATARRKVAEGHDRLRRLRKISEIEKLPWQLQVLWLKPLPVNEAAKTKTAVWGRFHEKARQDNLGREVFRSFVCKQLKSARRRRKGLYDVEGALDGLAEALCNTERSKWPAELQVLARYRYHVSPGLISPPNGNSKIELDRVS